MTCIVGAEYGNTVFLGGDIQGTGGNHKIIHTQPKVFNRNGVIFGYTTSYRFGQILEQNLQDPVVPQNKAEIYKWLCSVLIPDIRSTLKAHDYEGGGNCLIGVQNQLWEMQNDFSVLRSVKGYTACGSGFEYAMGSMNTYMEELGIHNAEDCVRAIRRAIKTAGTFSPSVGTDSVIISTEVL